MVSFSNLANVLLRSLPIRLKKEQPVTSKLEPEEGSVTLRPG